MTIALTTPVAGGPQTGFTSPTYTVVPDVAPTLFGKQWAVTAVGGAGNTPRIHSISDPFTFTASRAPVLRALPSANPTTGRYGSIPRNVHKGLTRKGVNYAANQPPELMLIRTEFDVPAGADAYNPVDVRAGLSLHFGAFWQMSGGFGDTVITGVP